MDGLILETNSPGIVPHNETKSLFGQMAHLVNSNWSVCVEPTGNRKGWDVLDQWPRDMTVTNTIKSWKLGHLRVSVKILKSELSPTQTAVALVGHRHTVRCLSWCPAGAQWSSSRELANCENKYATVTGRACTANMYLFQLEPAVWVK